MTHKQRKEETEEKYIAMRAEEYKKETIRAECLKIMVNIQKYITQYI